jgi:hypothetical protein
MKQRSMLRAVVVALVAVVSLAATACVPQGSATINWSFRGASMTVNNSQDEVCAFLCVNSSDEPYLLQVAFRVRIGDPGSADAWVVKGATPSDDVEAGQSRTFTGNQNAKVFFNGIQPLGLQNALNPSSKLEIFGTYTWAAEEDTFDTLSGAASDTASILENVLNQTVAMSQLPSGVDALVDLIVDNIGDALTLLLSNIIPTFGLADDTLGGGIFVGIGANGTLATLIDQVLATTSFPSVPLLGDNLAPPKIVGGGFYTLSGSKTFNQTFSGADGVHTWSLVAAPA